MTDLIVRIGGIEFRGFADRDDYGFWIGKDGWRGWDTAPAARADVLERPNSHGTTDSPQYLGAREVVQSGFFRARDGAELAHMARRLSGMLADGGSRKIMVEQAGSTNWANARRGLGQPDIVTHNDGNLFVGEYEVTYRCPDPRIYGVTHLVPPAGTATSVAVFHRGNFPAHSVVEIPSAPSSYSVTSPFGTFTVTGATAGGTHQIDMRTGLVTRNGVIMSGVGRGALWATPPGRSTAWTISVPGRVITTDTYV
ncbi:hypothetical protein F6W69_10690 [Microbacterium oxydans]|uniref:hypothetical protein n=1 Tax=Microbacterium oxydans TaxID=82380 RepID=UPI001142244D|nr:hypothetical protein [Microbacterium oxydans]KAB1891055.1 hypothetical protein F6W69_10690 [Microbacterium oxydans]GED39083.1 hypothetical protein MOX01_22250 [Microbacterium oxydans]